MAKKATSGNNAQFTYDFGIAIAQSTVNKVTRLTGVTLTLASAFYALKTTASEYVDTLRTNTLRFGGVLSTLKAIEQAQDRLIKGQSYFKVDDQLSGMNTLMAMGVKVGENFEWINKAAHATGKSFGEFSGAISAGISGNMQQLVDMGLLTQRATRMFDKYQGNTIMRQQAILNFVKTHKGLQNAIKNDFETVQDQMIRIKGIWTSFLKSILGKPNDPNSFYGQIVSSMKMVATALSNNMTQIKRYGFIIGQTLGWVIKQIGHFVVWVGGQVKKALDTVWKVTDNFQEQTRSMLVWLEFWKLKIIDLFKRYGNEIRTVIKLVIGYKVLKTAFVIGNVAILSVIRYRRALAGLFALQGRYIMAQGPFIGRFRKMFQSLAVFMPRWIRKLWVSAGKGLGQVFESGFKNFVKNIGSFLLGPFKLVFSIIRNFPTLFMAIIRYGRIILGLFSASNPVGWVILAISLFTTLYIKSRQFRDFVNGMFKTYIEYTKLWWNSLMWVYVQVRVWLIKAKGWFMDNIWAPVFNFFGSVGGWIGDMWDSFMNTSVGKWIHRNIVEPFVGLFNWIGKVWDKVMGGFNKVYSWLKGANKDVANATEALAAEHNIGVYTFGGDKGTVPISPMAPETPETPSTTDVVNPIVNNTKSRPNETYSEVENIGGTSMAFNKGAIQITIQKGENIDESKLARKIREVIEDMERSGRKRGGIS